MNFYKVGNIIWNTNIIDDGLWSKTFNEIQFSKLGVEYLVLEMLK